jgi:hypothetical protein
MEAQACPRIWEESARRERERERERKDHLKTIGKINQSLNDIFKVPQEP